MELLKFPDMKFPFSPLSVWMRKLLSSRNFQKVEFKVKLSVATLVEIRMNDLILSIKSR